MLFQKVICSVSNIQDEGEDEERAAFWILSRCVSHRGLMGHGEGRVSC